MNRPTLTLIAALVGAFLWNQLVPAQSVQHVASTTCKVRELPTGSQCTGWIAATYPTQGGTAAIVITNRHLVSLHHESHRDRYAVLLSGRKHPAARVLVAQQADLAAFVFVSVKSYPHATLARREAPRGSLVQTVGYPYFAGDKVYSAGRVRGGPLHAIEAEFKSESGQSGSPVVDASGYVCGTVWGKTRPHGPSDGIYVGCTPIRSFLRRVFGCVGLPPGYSQDPLICDPNTGKCVPLPTQPQLPIPLPQPEPEPDLPAPLVQPQLQPQIQALPQQLMPQQLQQLRDYGEVIVHVPLRIRWSQPDPQLQIFQQ